MNIKNKVLIIIGAVLLIAAIYAICVFLPRDTSTSAMTSSVEGSLLNPNAGEDAIIATDTSVTITTLDKWYEFNSSLPNCHYFSSGCYDILRMIILGQSEYKEFETVKLGSWKITRDQEKYADNELLFEFTVTSSELDTLPIGTYSAIINDADICTIEFLGEDPREAESPNASLSAMAVISWIRSTNSWSTPIFGAALNGTQSNIADYIINQYGENDRILASEFKKLLSDKFGITADENELNSVIIDKRLYIEKQFSNAKSYAQFHIIGDTVINGVNTVTVEFYADPTRFIKTDIVEYHLDDNERMLGCKRIHIGDYEPFEVYNTFKQ